MTDLISRRVVLSAGAGLLSSRFLFGQKGGLRVGCQTNGYALKAGDFAALLSALEDLKKLGYSGFENLGLRIAGAFDRDPAKIGQWVQGRKVQPVERLPSFGRRSRRS